MAISGPILKISKPTPTFWWTLKKFCEVNFWLRWLIQADLGTFWYFLDFRLQNTKCAITMTQCEIYTHRRPFFGSLAWDLSIHILVLKKFSVPGRYWPKMWKTRLKKSQNKNFRIFQKFFFNSLVQSKRHIVPKFQPKNFKNGRDMAIFVWLLLKIPKKPDFEKSVLETKPLDQKSKYMACYHVWG